jgi:hypothetical protein
VRHRLSIVLVLAIAALAGGGSAWAAGSKTYTDPAGDGSAGPDVTQLVISNDDNGQLTFAFTFANRPTILTGDDVVALGLDIDSNGGTGDPQGYEYIIGFGFQGQRAEVGKWNGSTYDFTVPETTLRVADGGRTISINRSELGGTMSFRSRVATSGNGGGDTAPEGGVTWDYALVLAPEIVAIRATFTPGKPLSGKAFALSTPTLRLSSGQTVPPEAFNCTATLGAKALRAAGRCRWVIPKKSKGKRLVIAVSATYGGVSATFDPYIFKVAR